jgi:hypothetical protein
MNLKSPFKFVISPIDGKQYNDTKKVGDVELITTTSIEEAIDVNRIGIVKSLPENYDGIIEVGDSVIIGHNVFRISYDHKGILRQSDWHIKNDLFAVPRDMIYMVIKDGKYIPTDDNVFVSPIAEESLWRGIHEASNVGIAKYVNDILKSQGIENGSKIVFKQGSKYIFEIAGERFFMMKNRRIVAKVN